MNITDLFIQLVQIDSPTGQEKPMADFLMSYLRERGYEAHNDAIGNVFVAIDGVGEPLFINAHMDTVSPGTGIKPTVSDGIIRSDGTTILGADDKVAIAAILATLERLKDKTHRPLEILFTVDEESESNGAKGFDYSQVRATEGLIADIGQPIGTIVLSSPAYIRFSILFTGEAGHPSRPELANSVLPAVTDFLASTTTGQLDELSIRNIGTVTVGTGINTIPGAATLRGEIRSYDGEKAEAYTAEIHERAQSLAEQYDLKLSFASQLDNPAYTLTKETPAVKTIAAVMESLNIAPAYMDSWSCSDANFFNTREMEVVVIGNGVVDAHTVHESVAVSALEQLTDVIEAYCLKGANK